MPIPTFNAAGDLPAGIYQASLPEVIERFGTGSPKRGSVTASLIRIHSMARATKKLDRLVIFGSYVTKKLAPNDVDIVLVMHDDFDMQSCDEATKALFDHRQAARVFGASIFWIRPAMLMSESLKDFIAHWQLKRDGRRRGIVQIKT